MLRRFPRTLLTAFSAMGLLAWVAAGPASAAIHRGGVAGQVPTSHVLLLSIDGMHQSDLQWYVGHHPRSALAALTRGGVEYLHAQSPVPSDSFPGMVGMATGGDPSTTGIYYDVTYNHALLPPGTTTCAPGTPRGAPVAYDESLDKNPLRLDAGQGLRGLPRTILNMTSSPQRLIDRAKLPVDPRTCSPILPHQYLRVNTVFEVARDHGLRTAWSDKHPAYEILNGPSGSGVQDLFTPEINSQAIGFPAGEDWTSDNFATRQYDSYKVKAVLNEIDGYDHGRMTRVGTPAIFGMNFQTVSTAEKLPSSRGLAGGYLPGGVTPGPLLSGALDFVNAKLGTMVSEINARGLAGSTTIILSAKHGQSPTDPRALTRVDDGPILDALNAAWAKAHPGAGDLVAFATDDDIMQLWLADHSQIAADFAKRFLLSHSAAGNTIAGKATTVTASGLKTAYAGEQVAGYFHVQVGGPRLPDLLGIVQHGVVYTGGTSKIAEHGGSDPQDRDVPLLIAGAAVAHGRLDNTPVETIRIAPTVLKLLGIDPEALRAVRLQHTEALRLR